MFDIGDEVQVVDAVWIYTLYDNWADVHGLSKYKYGAGIDKAIYYTVIARGFHSFGTEMVIYGITDGKHDYIIAEEGLKLAADPVQYEWLWYGWGSSGLCFQHDFFYKTKKEALDGLRSIFDSQLKKKHIHKVKGSKRKVEGK